ncbi:MAG: hypothetical protein CM1200mP41_07360 [Gammaproteobacteria bacterium]|nr:MAG: hypothetical protein CM1200mP41_07360 [Gammaproteobacteria bacterium]
MGAEGVNVSRLEEVGPALEKAIDAQMNAGVTTIIEIMCPKGTGGSVQTRRAKHPGSTSGQIQTIRLNCLLGQ